MSHRMELQSWSRADQSINHLDLWVVGGMTEYWNDIEMDILGVWLSSDMICSYWTYWDAIINDIK